MTGEATKKAAGPPTVSVGVVVERELVRLGRRWQTVAARATFAAVIFFFVGSAYTAQAAVGRLLPVSALSTIGRTVFLTWAGLLFAGVLVMTPVLVGQAVLDEKEDQTLQLLAITRLSAWRILWGTLLSRLVMMESLILAVLPVLAVVLSFGGVGPLEMLSAVVHVHVLMLVAGVGATFFALYARSVIVVLTQTWSWLLGGLMAGSICGAIAAGGGSGSLLGHPILAFTGSSGGQVGPWEALAVPTLSWGLVAGLAMYTANLCFATLALGERDADMDDADRSSGFWALEAFRKKVVPSVIVLALVAPLLYVARATGAVPYLPSIAAWCWFAAAMALSGVSVLLMSRHTTLKRNRKARERSLNRVGWKRLAAHYKVAEVREAPRREADGSRDVKGAVRSARKRKGRLLAPGQRRVWDDAVVWREVATAAHGRVRRLLFAWYAVCGVFVASVVVFGGLEVVQIAGAFGAMLLAGTPPLAVLLATSSIVGERRAGTLQLLRVTPLTPAQIVTQKLQGIAMLLAPTTGVGAVLLLVGSSVDGGLVLRVVCGLVWFTVVCGTAAALCLWRALGVKTPSRAWAANIVLVGAVLWCVSAATAFVAVLPDVLMGLWAVVVPFGIAAVDEDLLNIYLLASAGLWALFGSVCHLGAQRSLALRASEG